MNREDCATQEDDCKKFILSVSLYKWFPATVNFFEFFVKSVKKPFIATTFKAKKTLSNLGIIIFKDHPLWVWVTQPCSFNVKYSYS